MLHSPPPAIDKSPGTRSGPDGRVADVHRGREASGCMGHEVGDRQHRKDERHRSRSRSQQISRPPTTSSTPWNPRSETGWRRVRGRRKTQQLLSRSPAQRHNWQRRRDPPVFGHSHGSGRSYGRCLWPFGTLHHAHPDCLAFCQLRHAAALESGCTHNVLAGVGNRRRSQTPGGIVAHPTVPRFSTAASRAGPLPGWDGKRVARARPVTPDSPCRRPLRSVSITWRPFCPWPTLTRSDAPGLTELCPALVRDVGVQNVAGTIRQRGKVDRGHAFWMRSRARFLMGFPLPLPDYCRGHGKREAAYSTHRLLPRHAGLLQGSAGWTH